MDPYHCSGEMKMDFNKLVGESFDYAKEGLVGHWAKWIMLIILDLLPVLPIIFGVIFAIVVFLTAPAMLIPTIVIAVIFAIILAFPYLGYMVQIYAGEKPAPEVQNWGNLFSNGWKLFVVYFIYAIPLIIIGLVVLGSTLWTAFLAFSDTVSNPTALMDLIGAVLFGLIILLIVAFILWLIVATAVVRFARTKSIGEAFNFSAIFAHIGKIGIGSYIVALIIMAVIIGIIEIILSIIPYLGAILLFIVSPFVAVFQARYLSQLYDTAGAE